MRARRSVLLPAAVLAGVATWGLSIGSDAVTEASAQLPATTPVVLPAGTQTGTQATPAQAPAPVAPRATPAATVAATPAQTAAIALARMTLPQRVGQLFMVGTPASGADAGTVANQISQYHLGNVFLSGRSGAGVTTTAGVVAGFRARVSSATTASVPLLVGTDQEGGNVQVLSGPGFASIPTALGQGGWSSATEIANSAEWGRELHAAGVNLDLAPVTDTVPSAAFAPLNLPIGYWQREYGYDAPTVAAHSVAFTRGMSSAGVGTSVKHFPGLGYVTGNTDDTVHVVDSSTTRYAPAVGAFDTAIHAGAPVVMVSSAIYSRIDPANLACFSPTVMLGMLRGDAGFNGVIMTDSMGAAAVSPFPAGDRAVDFLQAGGDLVLTTAVNDLPAMLAAVTTRAVSDYAFRALIDSSVLRVLTLKAALGVLPPAMIPQPPSSPARSQPWGVLHPRRP